MKTIVGSKNKRMRFVHANKSKNFSQIQSWVKILLLMKWTSLRRLFLSNGNFQVSTTCTVFTTYFPWCNYITTYVHVNTTLLNSKNPSIKWYFRETEVVGLNLLAWAHIMILFFTLWFFSSWLARIFKKIWLFKIVWKLYCSYMQVTI